MKNKSSSAENEEHGGEEMDSELHELFLDELADLLCRVALELRAGQLLTAPRPTTLEEKVRRRLEKQQDHLFTFLEHADVDA
ncbi:MAG TPA: hypothetical protein VGO67_20325, partial [Verrucomicrobiae bacterium]